MATKSKTQRAKASEKRQARKAQKAEGIEEQVEVVETEAPKKGLFNKSEKKEVEATPAKAEAKPKKKVRFQFLQDVRSEMKRVTWPTRLDVLRWSGVVVAALLFFGIFVALLDNGIITPLLIAFSGLGA